MSARSTARRAAAALLGSLLLSSPSNAATELDAEITYPDGSHITLYEGDSIIVEYTSDIASASLWTFCNIEGEDGPTFMGRIDRADPRNGHETVTIDGLDVDSEGCWFNLRDNKLKDDTGVNSGPFAIVKESRDTASTFSFTIEEEPTPSPTSTKAEPTTVAETTETAPEPTEAEEEEEEEEEPEPETTTEEMTPEVTAEATSTEEPSEPTSEAHTTAEETSSTASATSTPDTENDDDDDEGLANTNALDDDESSGPEAVQDEDDDSDNKDSGGLSTGAKIGIGVGAGLGVAGIASLIAAVLIVKRRRGPAQRDDGKYDSDSLELYGDVPKYSGAMGRKHHHRPSGPHHELPG